MISSTSRSKKLVGVAAVASAAALTLAACSGSSEPAPSPSAQVSTATASPSPSPSPAPTPTFDGTVYKIDSQTKATVETQRTWSSESGIITVSSDNKKIHVVADGANGYVLDLVVHTNGRAASGQLTTASGGDYEVLPGGSVELGGLNNGISIGTQTAIPVTPKGQNGSLGMTFSASGVKQ